MSRMASVPTSLISGAGHGGNLSRHLLCISTDRVDGMSAGTIGCGLYDVHGINMNGRSSGRRLHLNCDFRNSMLSSTWSFEVQCLRVMEVLGIGGSSAIVPYDAMF